MRFSCSLSTDPELETACAEAAAQARERHGDHPVDLCVVFAAAGYARGLDSVPLLVHDAVSPNCLVGCSGGGIIGDGFEVEAKPAVSVALASMPGARLHARHLADGDLPDADAPPSSWCALFDLDPKIAKGFVVLPEPFSFATDRLLAGLDYAYPASPKVGGIASGHPRPGGQSLFLNRACHSSGAVALGLSGDVVLETVVAQGCKPVGAKGQITRAEGNQLVAVDGKPAVQFLREQIATLDGDDVELARSAVFMGIATDPFEADPGEFLIRNVLGVDLESGILSIGEHLSVGRSVQIHLRDRRASDEDLRSMLRRRKTGDQPQGALLFSCLGRGEHLYGEPHHDSQVFAQEVGQVPLGGFFCNGEIGPVGDSSYLHGYTSSFALFHPLDRGLPR